MAGILASNAGPDKQGVIADLIERVIVSNENMQIRIRGYRFVDATLPQQATSDVALSMDVPFSQRERTGVTKLLIEQHAANDPDPPPRQVELLLAGDPEASGSARQSMLSITAAYLWSSASS